MSVDHLPLRHTLATLAYRGGKVVRDAPEEFADLDVGCGARTPVQILAHVGDLLDWVLSQARGSDRWREATPGSWHDEVDRFFSGIEALDRYLASGQALHQVPERLFQGGIADAFTHVGQLAILRRMAGAPVRGENYNLASIQVGRVGRGQDPPRREFG